MTLEKRIKRRIAELKSDSRLTYDAANIQTNAPLALIQVSLKARIHELEDMIGADRTEFPIKETNQS